MFKTRYTLVGSGGTCLDIWGVSSSFHVADWIPETLQEGFLRDRNSLGMDWRRVEDAILESMTKPRDGKDGQAKGSGKGD